MPEPVALDPEVGEPEAVHGLVRRRVTFGVEQGQRALGWVLARPDLSGPAPAMICLQGHTSGGHISAGIERLERDAASIAGERDFAVQAARRGYVAFALEQRCFGERSDGRPAYLRGLALEHPISDERCRHQAMLAMLVGRTLVGERVHDVRCAVDFLGTLPEVDARRIACMGNSGGGTAAFYAACMDGRIHACMPSCAFCTYAHSICQHDHCSDNYLPGALLHFEMGDLAALIAPRPMVVVSGREDPLFWHEGVMEAVETARDIYGAFGATDRIAHVIGDGGHRFYAEAGWNAFLRLSLDGC
jgi:dienelactone hydrolase